MSALEDHPIDPIKNGWGVTVILFYPHEGSAIFRRGRKTNMYVWAKPKRHLCRPSIVKHELLGVITGANQPLFSLWVGFQASRYLTHSKSSEVGNVTLRFWDFFHYVCTANNILHLSFSVCFYSSLFFSLFLFHLLCSFPPLVVFI